MPAPPGSAGRLCDPDVAPAVLGYAHLLPPTTMQVRRVELPLHTRALEARSSSFDEAGADTFRADAWAPVGLLDDVNSV